MATYSDGYEYHIHLSEGDIGRYVFLPGDPGRCETIAQHFDNPRFVASHREHTTWAGELDGIPVAVTSTGMGGPSTAIAVEELIHVGADTFMRVGTSGAMQPETQPGDIAVISAAIRDEGTGLHYLPVEFPAVADLDLVNGLVAAAKGLDRRYHVGVSQSKDSFYGQHSPDSMPVGPRLRERWDAVKDGWREGWTPWRIIAAGLAAIDAKLRYRLIEQEPDLGGSVFHYPRHKIAMTQPVELPVVGTMRFTEVSKEALLAFWRRIVGGTGLRIHYSERFEKLEGQAGAFRVVTSRGSYDAGQVLLAIGRRGTPRKLGVEGEELPKVVYRLVDPAQYRGQRVLVVGGGDSAVEAALACASEQGTEVTLAYRGEAFNRIKAANRERLEAARAEGSLDVLTSTDVARIVPDHVVLVVAGTERRVRNDRVIVQAGGILPTELLRSIGIEVETKFGSS